MGGLISAIVNKTFIDLQNSSHADYMTGNVVWKRSKKYLQPFNEDYSEVQTPTDDGFEYIPLPVLFNFNYERTWPVTDNTETGDIDRQSNQLYFSRKQLSDLGYITESGNFAYDSGVDRFIINGIIYHAEGDTNAAQIIGNNELVFTLLVRPDIKQTGLDDVVIPPIPIPTPAIDYRVSDITIYVKTNPISFDPNNPDTYCLLRNGNKIPLEYPVGNTITIPYLQNKFVYQPTIVLNDRPATYINYASTIFDNSANVTPPDIGFNDGDKFGFLYEDIFN